MTAAPWFWPLVITMVMQAQSAFAARGIAVFGPVLTEVAGVTPEQIGILAAINTVGTMLFLICGAPILQRLGPVRSLQLGALSATIGIAVAGFGTWPMMMLSALLIGLGYGPSPPAGSEILARYAPKQHRAVIFSVKQAGVPVGGVIAGLVMPLFIAWYDWRVALLLVAALTGLPALVVQPTRATMDADRNRDLRLSAATLLSPANVLEPFRAVLATPALIRLSMVGFSFAIAQGCLFSFQVTFLNVESGLSLALAGSLFAVTQAVSIGGRVFTGWAADRLGSGLRMLMLLGIGSGALMWATAMIAPNWPRSAMMVVSALSGLAVGSWNGVYLSEVAAHAPKGKIAEATAGSTFLTFLGYVCGPIAFALAVQTTGHYSAAFIAAGVLPLVASLGLMRLK
ncbi:MAG: MFS transporter [Alphaproteobacteria bacterium]|nr:MFS transporter [Alphaproteobacteria bacterium]